MLDSQRHLFNLPDDSHYLNCAYMSPLAKPVEDAGLEGLRRKRMPADISVDDFFEASTRLRALFARLINAPDARRVAIIPSASYGIATAARNTDVRPGQNIVLVEEQFPGNVYEWRSLCRRQDLELRTVAAPALRERRGAAWNERVLAAIDADTAAVALGNVHWTDGTRFDLDTIGERAREVGAALIVDGTQSVGAMPFDVQKTQPDALVCAGYKWLLGPYSVGVAWYGPRYDDGVPLEETWIAREGSEDFRALVDYQDAYQSGAVRYDVGERSNFILVPMLVAALELLLDWGVTNIQAYCGALTRDLIGEARELGFAVEDDDWRGSHILGLRAPPGRELARLQPELVRRNVHVSLRGSAMRVSPNVYNDAGDVAALREALRHAR
jgi:selenocysteine lyase/cysteine desulfurase